MAPERQPFGSHLTPIGVALGAMSALARVVNHLFTPKGLIDTAERDRAYIGNFGMDQVECMNVPERSRSDVRAPGRAPGLGSAPRRRKGAERARAFVFILKENAIFFRTPLSSKHQGTQRKEGRASAHLDTSGSRGLGAPYHVALGHTAQAQHGSALPGSKPALDARLGACATRAAVRL